MNFYAFKLVILHKQADSIIASESSNRLPIYLHSLLSSIAFHPSYHKVLLVLTCYPSHKENDSFIANMNNTLTGHIPSSLLVIDLTNQHKKAYQSIMD